MSKLKEVLNRVASKRGAVEKHAKFDKKNLADKTRKRSKIAANIVAMTKRTLNKIFPTDVAMIPEDFDLDISAKLILQSFIFSSVANDSTANLLELRILAGVAESLSITTNRITITTDAGVSDHDSIKALIEASSRASAMITVAIIPGDGAVLVAASSLKQFSGAV